MLEKIVNKTKVGLVAAALAGSLYGCGITRSAKVNSPVTGDFRGQVYPCGGENNRNLYCDETYVYPVVVVELK